MKPSFAGLLSFEPTNLILLLIFENISFPVVKKEASLLLHFSHDRRNHIFARRFQADRRVHLPSSANPRKNRQQPRQIHQTHQSMPCHQAKQAVLLSVPAPPFVPHEERERRAPQEVKVFLIENQRGGAQLQFISNRCYLRHCRNPPQNSMEIMYLPVSP